MALCILTRGFACVLLLLAVEGGRSLSQLAAENKKIVLKVNLGGGPVGDFLGEDQVLDMSAFSKNVARVRIENTDQAEIFQTTRFARGKDMTLRLPVPTGIYSVTLLFAETYRPACVPGARVFDISLGTPVSGVAKVVDAFDVFQSAGCLAAHGKRFDKVPSKDGIVVHLTQKAQNPALCGFVVEGFPLPVGDGSEYKAVGREEPPSAAGVGGQPVVTSRRRSSVRRLASVPEADVPAAGVDVDADADADADAEGHLAAGVHAAAADSVAAVVAKPADNASADDSITPHALHQPVDQTATH